MQIWAKIVIGGQASVLSTCSAPRALTGWPPPPPNYAWFRTIGLDHKLG